MESSVSGGRPMSPRHTGQVTTGKAQGFLEGGVWIWLLWGSETHCWVERAVAFPARGAG